MDDEQFQPFARGVAIAVVLFLVAMVVASVYERDMARKLCPHVTAPLTECEAFRP